MNNIKYFYSAIVMIIFIVLCRSFWNSSDQNKKIPVDQCIISIKQEKRISPQAISYGAQDSNGVSTGNFSSRNLLPPQEEYIDDSPEEINTSDINDETEQPDIFEKEEIELFILDAAIQNIPIDMVSLGRLKEYYINANNLVGYQQFVESLSDSYEMKNELLSDLAFLYQENGQVNESVNLIRALSDRDQDNMRLKYYVSDIYLGAGNFDMAINSLSEAVQIGDDPYQYERIADIYKFVGDNAVASFYVKCADGLKAIMHHD